MYMLIFFFLNLENSKYEKYRSNRGGITVKSLSNINDDDLLQAE